MGGTNIMMKVFLLIAVWTAVAAAQCSIYSGCSECTGQVGCGWCQVTQRCYPGSEQGPSNPMQPCLPDFWSYGECKPVELKEGKPFTQKHAEKGFYDYYSFQP